MLGELGRLLINDCGFFLANDMQTPPPHLGKSRFARRNRNAYKETTLILLCNINVILITNELFVNVIFY